MDALANDIREILERQAAVDAAGNKQMGRLKAVVSCKTPIATPDKVPAGKAPKAARPTTETPLAADPSIPVARKRKMQSPVGSPANNTTTKARRDVGKSTAAAGPATPNEGDIFKWITENKEMLPMYLAVALGHAVHGAAVRAWLVETITKPVP